MTPGSPVASKTPSLTVNHFRPSLEVRNRSPDLDQLYAHVSNEQKRLWAMASLINIPWQSEPLSPGLTYKSYHGELFGAPQNIRVAEYQQGNNPQLTLLVSKISEAITPGVSGNHRGTGVPLNHIPKVQPGIRFMMNGGYSHYRKDYYPWPTSFEVGDPVGYTQIRRNIWLSVRDPEELRFYGYLVQRSKGAHFEVLDYSDFVRMGEAQYVLSCSPFMIRNGDMVMLDKMGAFPLPEEAINPPGHLGHLFRANPRTMIGIREDNTLVFVTVDGRNEDHSKGFTIAEMTALMRVLNVKNAVNFDGGGSTLMYVKRDNSEGEVVNQTELERAIGNALIIFDESLKVGS